jgi:Type II secretion system (T2SS), protein E, N-terminal domain
MAGDKKMGNVLVEKGLITAEQLRSALHDQLRTKEFLGDILLRKKQIKPGDFLAALSEIFKIPCVELKNVYIDNRCVPIEKDGYAITVAITNPTDIWALRKAEQETKGFKLKLVLVSREDMEEVIKRYKLKIRGDILGL